ncbi:ketoacyl-ACP synthase III [Solitalea sp. MAHUQ-68]|uniref:Ketoacyl-ACP synthase III n=1 Tax=Solitalea agri TaxID=2953739 RepID=A0A9X2F000_9SPHI|nr:ketoacyl-ACP synthase III [Solitalea agri]MCO4291589.1 ketoacyl-ACP synthase III [Solitalea agri]
MQVPQTVITGTGSFIPSLIKTNRDFAAHDFYDEKQQLIDQPPAVIAEKFQQITGIAERRYATCELNSSDLAILAAKEAIEDAGIDMETIDQIIVAHNAGNIIKHTNQTDLIPSLASRIKHGLGIKNPSCIPYDLIFGCPGWLQGVIQADAFIKAGVAKKCLVIGTETLSRMIDIYDRDSMIFSDGAGACIVEAAEPNETPRGILASSVISHCTDEVDFLYMGKSNFPGSDPRVRYIKMKGRKVFEYAMKHVPAAMKNCLDKSGVDIKDIKKIFLHQANEKMDEGFTKELFKLYGIKEIPENIMPMSIHKLGNSSVATIPTLYDLVRKGKLGEEHEVNEGDVILFASVGAGMNINAVCYRA